MPDKPSASDAPIARDQVRLALRERFALKPGLVSAALTIAMSGLRHAQAVKRRLRSS